jgi:hypothetical protein
MQIRDAAAVGASGQLPAHHFGRADHNIETQISPGNGLMKILEGDT